MMKIGGLTPHQTRMLDKLWSINSHDELDNWIVTLDQSDQVLASSLAKLLILQYIDDTIDSGPQDFSEVNQTLSKIFIT